MILIDSYLIQIESKLFFGTLIQREKTTLAMNLKWNLKGIPGTKIAIWCNAWLLTG